MNLPNRITLVRLLLIPIFVFFYLADFIPYGKLVAMIIFMIASFTDFLDGNIARKRNLVTTLGKFLDPLADKLLVMAGFLLIAAYPVSASGSANLAEPILMPTYIGIVAVIIILVRELMVTALRAQAAAKGVVLAADMYGKVKAVFQFITIIYYMLYAFLVEEFYSSIQGVPNTVIALIGYILLAITVILTIVSGCNYIIKNKAVFKDDDKDKEKLNKKETEISEEVVVKNAKENLEENVVDVEENKKDTKENKVKKKAE